MTIPIAYHTASADFARFIDEAKTRTGDGTTNMTWGTLLGVFEVFRRRLTVEQSVEFAKALPPILCSIYIADLHARPPIPFADRAQLTDEVQAVHRDHQFATRTAIEDIAAAVRGHVDQAAFDVMLSRLPLGARDFWHVDARH